MSEGKEKSQMKIVKDTEAPPAPPAPTPLAQDQEDIKLFLDNPEHKSKAAQIAHQISAEFPSWFSIPRLLKKFDIVQAEAARQIEMLMLFHFCVAKVEKGIPLFKIDLDRRTQRELLLKQIEEKEGEILFLKEKLAALN